MSETEMSLRDLESMITERKKRLTLLAKRREKLAGKLAALDEQIESVGGSAGGTGRTRPQNDKPLATYVLEILGKRKGGLVLGDLVEAVRASGYKSNSKNFGQVVYLNVYRLTNEGTVEKDANSKKYRLVAGK